MAKKKKRYDDDDGRVIAKMNVEGMPWYSPGHTRTLSEQEREDEEDTKKPEHYVEDELTPDETKWVMFGAMRAGCVFGIITAVAVTIAGVIAVLVLGGVNW